MSFSIAAVTSRPGAYWRSLSWLSRVALMVLLSVVGAVALSVGLWWKDGSPAVQASFGGPRPNFGRPGQRPGGGANGGLPQRAPGQGAPGQQAGGQGQIPGRQGGQQPGLGRPDGATNDTSPFQGTVQAFAQGNLSVRTSDGVRFVRVGPSTLVVRADGSTGSSSDLGAGVEVEVTTALGGGFLSATEVRLQ